MTSPDHELDTVDHTDDPTGVVAVLAIWALLTGTLVVTGLLAWWLG